MVDYARIVLECCIGLCVGSFLNVVVCRLPVSMINQVPSNLCLSRSRCPGCATQLAVRDNIPLFSWLWLKGRCRQCQMRISWQYPFTELLFMFITLALCTALPVGMVLAAALIFSASLTVLAQIDAQHKLLPDVLTLSLVWAGLIFSAAGVLPAMSAAASIGGAVTGYSMLWSLRAIFLWLRKKEALGLGDVKFSAALGAWLGIQNLIEVLMLASVGGTFYILLMRLLKSRETRAELPFGPFLCLAGAMIFYRSLLA